MQRYTFFLILPNFYVVFSILGSEKEFSKNSSLITRSAISCCSIEVYSVGSPYTTRHHTHHPNRCILLRMWILYVQFTLSPLVTLKKVTSELSSQLLLSQNDMLCEGDEWVTSEAKWITAVMRCIINRYRAMGDELTSSMKILFFFCKNKPYNSKSLMPSLSLRSSSVPKSVQIRSATIGS